MDSDSTNPLELRTIDAARGGNVLMWVLTLLLGVLVVLAITAVTGYFVAQEFAYMAVDRSRLSALRAAAGDAGAQRALSVTRRTSFMLSGAQLGITVTGPARRLRRRAAHR